MSYSSKSRVKGYLKLQLSFLAPENRLVPQSETPGKQTFLYSTCLNFNFYFFNLGSVILFMSSATLFCHVEGDNCVGQVLRIQGQDVFA